MRIAMIGSKGIPARSGGVEQHVEALSLQLAAAGHDVIVYTRPWYSRRELGMRNKELGTRRVKSVMLIPLPSIRTKHLDAITHTLFASFDVLWRDVDVVHYHGIGPALLLWIPKLFSRVLRFNAPPAVVVTFHCQDYHHQKWNWFARLALRAGEWMASTMADETIVVSRELEHYVWTAYQRRAVYIPNGVHAPRRVSVSHLKKWKLNDRGYILFVGRLVRHKGVHTLIAAYRRMSNEELGMRKSKRTLPPLVIVGAGANTANYEKELRVLARGLPIRFLGEQHDNALAALVANAQLIVHPSVSEGMSLFLLEAMNSGTPVLASDIPENREVLARSATTFAADDARDLARKIAWCLSHTRVMAKRAVQAQQIVSEYTWERVGEDTRHVYEHAVWIRYANSVKLQEKLAR